jgi:septum formation protein
MEQRLLTPHPVLGADTEVVLDGAVFGKPRDAADAVGMLSRLSGHRHEVLTGVALKQGDDIVFAMCTSHVTFRQLSGDEIARYVGTGEALDKAGAYAIQGRAGAFISRLDGSYSGVMGLPLFETAGLLAIAGIPVL